MNLADLLKDPAQLSEIGTSLSVGGQLMGAFSHIAYGRQARQAGAFEAAQLRTNAGQQLAASQQAAANVDQRTKLITSRALAVAAASGGGASDPTVVNTIAAIAGEGAYRRALAIYQGEEAARAMEGQADSAEYRGKATQAMETRAAIGQGIGAGTSLLKGMERTASLRAKYGLDGPKSVKSEVNTSMWDNWEPGDS